MAGSKYPLTFRIFKGSTFVREETIAQSVIKIGKLSSSHVKLEDDSVSRMHAVIEVSGPNEANVIDLGSAKGTFVNGQKINKARLESGDEIRVGDTRMVVTIGEAVQEMEEEVPTAVRAVDSELLNSTVPSSQSIPAVAAVGSPASSGSGSPVPGFGADKLQEDLYGGAKAVEVAAMFGDSVVGVKHCMDPQGGKVKTATYAIFVFGAAMLFLSVAAFTRSIQNAEQNKEAFRVHIEEKKKPAYKFRENRLSLVYDWMAFGGAAAGLFAFGIGLVRIRQERVSPYYRIGKQGAVDFATDVSDVAPGDNFPLVSPFGDDFVLNVTDRMRGEVLLEHRSIPLGEAEGHASDIASGVKQLSIPENGRVRVEVGKNVFLVTSVPKPHRYPVPFVLDTRLLAYLGSVAGVIMGFLLLSWSALLDADVLVLEMDSREGRITNVESKAHEEDKPEDDTKGRDQDKSGGTGTAMALESGKMGTPDSDRAKGQYRMEKTSEDEALAKQKAIDEVRDVGISGLLRAEQGSVFASLTGTADFSSGLDDVNVYGGLLGEEAGEMQGGFGFGRSGFGQGGGGTGYGTIGTGRYGTIGHGSGTGSGYNAGGGGGGMRGRTAKVPTVNIGNPTATGNLDKAIIRRYIRRKLPRIKHCYQRELVVKKDIKGTVVTSFQISPSGSVLGSTAKGVDPQVSDCVASVIKSIQFPKPSGGGLVQVRYPFHFRAAGE